MSMMISPADTAPTDSSFEYWFDGDLLHGPEHGSLRDGFLEFYPRTHAAQGRNMQIQWFSQGQVQPELVTHDPVWPPEDDELDGPPKGRNFEIWHEGNYTFPETGDGSINYRDDYPGERLAVGTVFGSFGAFRRHISTDSGGQTLNQQALVFWDLSNLPPGQQIQRVELICSANTTGPSHQLNLTWVTRQDTGPHGYPGWITDYAHRSGNAFRGDHERFREQVQNRSLELRNINHVRRTKLIGLHACYSPNPPPPLDEAQSANTTMGWRWWVQGWDWYREFGTASDARSALRELPGLRIHFAPDDEPDEPLTRHDARQVRARHSTPRQVGRMKT